VFKITTNGTLTHLYSFTGSKDSGGSGAEMMQSSDGNFYGTTGAPGTDGQGTVFKISTNGALTILYSFTSPDDGASPDAALVQGGDGNFYGTTYTGGTSNAGTVFKISTNGANGALTSLYSFSYGYDGGRPDGLVLGGDGNFYGTTEYGGTNGSGTVFKISTNGVLATLYSFTGSTNGAYPQAALVQGSDASFYGTTKGGGTNGYGTVFRISANGVLTSLYSFGSVWDHFLSLDGAYPFAALVQGRDGSFYGATANRDSQYGDYPMYGDGTVFKISTNGALTHLHSFGMARATNAYSLDGSYLQAGLVQGGDGYFYGTTEFSAFDGFDYVGFGTVFKISPNGALITLYSFGSARDTNGDSLDGANPSTGLVQGADGNFYGTTSDSHPYTGVRHAYGTVFQITTNGVLTTLHFFTGGNDGGNPQGALVQGHDGTFYGTTSEGGAGGSGTVFRLTVVPDPPVLTIFSSKTNLVLTWPANATGYHLQFTTNLLSPVWTTNSFTPVLVNGQNTVTKPISGTQQFFRLSQLK
jgi:uncharacterized repeat protein (TIGR03803 family)